MTQTAALSRSRCPPPQDPDTRARGIEPDGIYALAARGEDSVFTHSGFGHSFDKPAEPDHEILGGKRSCIKFDRKTLTEFGTVEGAEV